MLDRYGIKVELTSTLRTGFHRYTFPRDASQQVMIRLGGMLGPSNIKDGELTQVNKTTLTGHLINGPTVRRPNDTPIFFAIKLNKEISEISGRSENGVTSTYLRSKEKIRECC
tara:strand:+ start:60 stop:398 length:339 start_codon:yes stop_codon:yes gene_type:complete